MGILNITPDSFSDGSELALAGTPQFQADLDKVLFRASAMVRDGAALLDVGGESTRPGAGAVTVDEEISRVIPVLESLRSEFDVLLSLDSSTPAVMGAAIAVGVDLVNDVRALTLPDALTTVASHDVALCLMHMQGEPRSMQDSFQYQDVVKEVGEFLQQRILACEAAGVSRERLLIDPGFGFGKSVQHNYRLLKHLPELAALQIPLLVGVSRKSMIAAVTGRAVDQRLAGSVAAASLALQGGAAIIRSHDVAATVDAIRVHCAFENA